MAKKEDALLMPPKHKGLTRTEAVGESKRCLPSRLFGGGAERFIVL
jgi:hypothetical protein